MGGETSDEELMERYRDGEAGAFDILYRRHKGGLFRYLYRLCGQQALAEELFQDVWSNIIRARASYQPSARFTTFLYRVAHNRVADHARRLPHLALVALEVTDDEYDPPVLQVAADSGAQPEAMVARRRLAECMAQAIESLPALQREAFLLREEGGLSLEEIAHATGVTAETAKSRLRYAVAKLRAALEGQR